MTHIIEMRKEPGLVAGKLLTPQLVKAGPDIQAAAATDDQQARPRVVDAIDRVARLPSGICGHLVVQNRRADVGAGAQQRDSLRTPSTDPRAAPQHRRAPGSGVSRKSGMFRGRTR